MATVSDTISCPQCGAAAYYEVNTRTHHEFEFCERCGYSCDTRDETGPKEGHGAYTYGDAKVAQGGAFQTPHAAAPFREWLAGDEAKGVTFAFVRLPPLYRTEFLRGEPEGLGDLSQAEISVINEVLAPFGETVAAMSEGKLYTKHPEQSGLKCFSAFREDGKLKLALPGDHLDFLTIVGDKRFESDPEETRHALDVA